MGHCDEWYKVEYNEAFLLRVFQGQDAAVSTITIMSVSQQHIIIDVATKDGVKRFIPSDFECDTYLPHVLEYAPTTRGKPEVVAYLKSKEPEGLSWTATCCGNFFDYISQRARDV